MINSAKSFSQTFSSGSENSEAARIMQVLNQASFALDDIVLYLDTHPADPDALAYYQYVKNLRSQAMNAYTDQYGPLLNDQVNSGTEWTWANGPWPWEGGMN